MQQVQRVMISTAEERKQLSGILTANGYTVRPVRIRQKGCKSVKIGIEFFKEDTLRDENAEPNEVRG